MGGSGLLNYRFERYSILILNIEYYRSPRSRDGSQAIMPGTLETDVPQSSSTSRVQFPRSKVRKKTNLRKSKDISRPKLQKYFALCGPQCRLESNRLIEYIKHFCPSNLRELLLEFLLQLWFFRSEWFNPSPTFRTFC